MAKINVSKTFPSLMLYIIYDIIIIDDYYIIYDYYMILVFYKFTRVSILWEEKCRLLIREQHVPCLQFSKFMFEKRPL